MSPRRLLCALRLAGARRLEGERLLAGALCLAGAPRGARADTSEVSVGLALSGGLAPAGAPRDALDAADALRGGGELRLALGLSPALWLYARLGWWRAQQEHAAAAAAPCPFSAPCAERLLRVDASAQRATLGLALQPLDDLSPALWGGLGVERAAVERGEELWRAGGEVWRGATPSSFGARWGLAAAAGAGVEWRCASRLSVGAGVELSARWSPWEPAAPAPLWVSALAWASWNGYAPLF